LEAVMSSKSPWHWGFTLAAALFTSDAAAQTAWNNGTFVDGQALHALDLNRNNAWIIAKTNTSWPTGIPTNGQIAIGNGTGYVLNTITAGSNITIANGPGSITISATGLLATPLTNGHVFIGSASNIATDKAISGDCGLVNSGAITCTKTNGTAFAASATTDATNAANISSGTLSASRLPDVTTAACYIFDSNTTAASGNLSMTLPWSSGTVTGLVGQTGGTGSPSFFGNALLAGVALTGTLTVNSTTPNTQALTGTTTWSSANPVLTLTVTSPSGTPNQASLCATIAHSAN
jgi:hypothetical protein